MKASVETNKKLEELRRQIERMSPGRRLQLAGQMLEAGEVELSITIAEAAIADVQAIKLFAVREK